MSSRDIHISAGFDPHAAQVEIWRAMQEFRFVVADCGRRMGKSVLAKAIQGKTLLDGLQVGYMTPNYSMLDEMWRAIKVMLAPVIVEKSEQLHRFDLSTGGMFKGFSLDNPDSPRSWEFDLVVVDEAALLSSIDIWNNAIYPTLATRRGKALFLSTPRGLNWFYDIYTRGLDDRFPLWRSFKFPTSANPHIDPAELEEIKRSVPERTWNQEYLAEFLSGEGDVFRNVDEMAHAVWQQEPIPGHAYVMGIDFARVEDFSCVSIIDCTNRQQCYQDRSNGIEYNLQIGRVQALFDKFHPLCVIVEDNSMGGVVEQLERRGLPVVRFHTSNPTKMILVDTLAVALERGELLILPDPVLIGELKAFRPTQLPSGLVRYSAPPGRHDDTVMALMLSYYAASTQAAGEAAYLRWVA